MRSKRKMTSIFFILSILFAILSMPISGALTTGKLQRTTSAKVVEDSKGALKLEGFQNKSINTNHKYSNFGTVSNNTNQIMRLTVTVMPEIGWLNVLSSLRFKIGTEELDFSFGSGSPKQITLILSPGQTINASASLVNNITGIKTSFQFTATNPDASYSMLLSDSVNSPRNITCY